MEPMDLMKINIMHMRLNCEPNGIITFSCSDGSSLGEPWEQTKKQGDWRFCADSVILSDGNKGQKARWK